MKRMIVVFFIAAAVFSRVLADGLDSPMTVSIATPTPDPVIVNWSPAKVPWARWFKNNALVTDKTEYVHFFWNAQDFKASFELKDKKKRLYDAALALVSGLYPADAKADMVKVTSFTFSNGIPTDNRNGTAFRGWLTSSSTQVQGRQSGLEEKNPFRTSRGHDLR